MTAEPVKAWAVVRHGVIIKPNTVAATRRAAIINWLVTDCLQFVGNHHTDADIEFMWTRYAPAMKAEVREVIISLPDA